MGEIILAALILYAGLATVMALKKHTIYIKDEVETEVETQIPEGYALMSKEDIIALMYQAYSLGKKNFGYVDTRTNVIFGPVRDNEIKGMVYLNLRKMTITEKKHGPYMVYALPKDQKGAEKHNNQQKPQNGKKNNNSQKQPNRQPEPPPREWSDEDAPEWVH